MIKEALKYVVGLAAPVITEIDGDRYSDKELYRICDIPYAKEIQMTTLTSFVDYLKSGIDSMSDGMIIHVVSPTEVRLYSDLDEERKREQIAVVRAQIPEFEFDRFIDNEKFCIALQSKFLNTGDRANVLAFAGTVEDGTIAKYSDDGISQRATVQSGISNKETKIVPNPVRLAPYRTFVDVDQPVSSFVFRMRSAGGVECALFEADGGAWKNEAMDSIREYLQTELMGLGQFIIIA